MANANEKSPAKRICFQCHRPAEIDDGRCRFCILEVEASEAFWAVIVRHFPEARSGDLSPWRTINQIVANVDAIEEWIGNNVETQEADDETRDRECDQSTPIGGPTHCKTCASEIVETINDSNFHEGECGPCEYQRYKGASSTNQDPPWYVGESICESVYGGEKHWAILADNCRGIVADLEGGLTSEAKARADLIVRACNSHEELLNAGNLALEEIEQWVEVMDGSEDPRTQVAIKTLKSAIGKAHEKAI
jgi:hypothetical protein